MVLLTPACTVLAFTVGRESRSSILSSVWSVSPSPLSAPTFRLLRPRANSVNARLLFHVGRVNLGAQRPVDPTFTRSVKVRSNTLDGRAGVHRRGAYGQGNPGRVTQLHD